MLGQLQLDIDRQGLRLEEDRERAHVLRDRLFRRIRMQLTSPKALAISAAVGFGVGMLRRCPIAGDSHVQPDNKVGLSSVWITFERLTRLLAGSALLPFLLRRLGTALGSRSAGEAPHVG